MTQYLEGPIYPGGAAKIGRAGAGRNQDHYAAVGDPQAANQTFQGADRWYQAGHTGPGFPPAIIGVIAVNRTGNMAFLEAASITAIIDSRAHIQHH